MKKYLYLFIATLMAVLAAFVFAEAEENILTLPSQLLTIDEEAFYGDNCIEKVILPEGLESIGKNAFANSSATTVTFPKSLTDIDDTAFAGTSIVGTGLPGMIP